MTRGTVSEPGPRYLVPDSYYLVLQSGTNISNSQGNIRPRLSCQSLLTPQGTLQLRLEDMPMTAAGTGTDLHQAVDIEHKLCLAKVGPDVLSVPLKPDGRIELSLDFLEGNSCNVCQYQESVARA